MLFVSAGPPGVSRSRLAFRMTKAAEPVEGLEGLDALSFRKHTGAGCEEKTSPLVMV